MCRCRHTSAPIIFAIPLVGRTRPQSIRIVVVFPAPFAPRNPKMLPGAISSERSSTARVSRYDLLRRSRKMAGSVIEMEKPLHYGNRCDIFKMEKKSPEATRSHPVSPSMRIFSFICLLSLWSSNALADPVSELSSFSVFDKIDLAALAKGDPNVAHGSPMSGRYISAQSCFIVAAPPLRVAEALSRWKDRKSVV